jgi:hypothetical protein
VEIPFIEYLVENFNFRDNGWLRPHKTSAEEIENLFMIIDRDLKDAEGSISDDWRFGIAYNAAVKRGG